VGDQIGQSDESDEQQYDFQATGGAVVTVAAAPAGRQQRLGPEGEDRGEATGAEFETIHP